MDWELIGIILALIFFGSTTILAIRLAKRKKLVWAYKTEEIIGLKTSTPRDLKLFFKNKPVTNVYRTTFIVFNKGEIAIRKEDVTKRITVSFSGAKILERPSIRPSNDEVKFSAKRISRGQDSAVELDFSYVDHNDGAIVEVLHTKYKDIKCTGNILEAGEPRYIGEFNPHRPEGFYGAIVLLILFSAMLAWMWFNTVSGAVQTTIDWNAVAILALFTAVFIYFTSYSIRSLLRYMQFRRWGKL